MISNSMALSISTLCDGLYCIRFKTRVCMFCSIAAFLNFPVRREERERVAKRERGKRREEKRERECYMYIQLFLLLPLSDRQAMTPRASAAISGDAE